jgi:hypothetical protein
LESDGLIFRKQEKK